MKKLNKKGFTLVEMLVVIAIIAVLVAIIIPTTSSATSKAAAATNAANLRSILAEATTDYLSNVPDTTGYVKFTPADGTGDPTFELTETAPKAKKVDGCAVDTVATITFTSATKTITVKYGEYTIDDFAKVAEKGGTLAAGSGSGSGSGG